MSHIPSAAMPHAKTHEPAPTPVPARLPWLAIALGGALALGGVAVAARILRAPAKPQRRVTRKSGSTTPRRRGKTTGRAKAGASRAARPPAD